VIVLISIFFLLFFLLSIYEEEKAFKKRIERLRREHEVQMDVIEQSVIMWETWLRMACEDNVYQKNDEIHDWMKEGF